MQPDRAGIVNPERVEQVCEVEPREELDPALARQFGQVGVRETLAGVRGSDGEVVRHQRVHAVHRDELLGQRKRHAGVIGRRPGNPGEDVVVGELRKDVLQPAEPSVPVRS